MLATVLKTKANESAPLVAAIGMRFYPPNLVPPKCARPYVTYKKDGTEFHVAMGRIVGDHARVSLTSWANTMEEAEEVSLLVRGAFIQFANAEIAGVFVEGIIPESESYTSAMEGEASQMAGVVLQVGVQFVNEAP